MGTNAVSVKAPSRKKYLYMLVAGVVLGALATLAFVRIFPDVFFRRATSPDDLILMAGGSLTIRGASSGQFHVTGSGDKAFYTPAAGSIVQLDVLYHEADGTPAIATLPFDSASSVQLNYCADAAHCASHAVHGNASGHGMEYEQVAGNSIPDGTNIFSQVPLTGYVHSVVFGRTTYLCRDAAGVDGKCSVVVHYCRTCR